MNDNYQAAMSAPIQQANSDGSSPEIEMYPDSWETIREYTRDALGLFGLFCAALVIGLLALRAFT